MRRPLERCRRFGRRRRSVVAEFLPSHASMKLSASKSLGCIVVVALPLAALLVDPPPLHSIHNISVSIESQIERSILAAPKRPRDLRIVFMSNCFFHGAIQNGNKVAILPDSLGIVGRFKEWAGGQSEFAGRNVVVFNASVDGTSILDHIAIVSKLARYKIDAVVIAMAYTEFRTLPGHPLLGTFSSELESLGVFDGNASGWSRSRGRWISMDFQRWLTASKFQLSRVLVFPENLLLWNRELRALLASKRIPVDYSEIYGGKPVPVRHIGLRSAIDQNFRPYLARFVAIANAGGAHVVLVNQPIRFKDDIEAANPGLFESHRSLLRNTAKTCEGCSFVDLDALVSVEQILSDYIHLTYDGTETVARVLSLELKKIIAGA